MSPRLWSEIMRSPRSKKTSDRSPRPSRYLPLLERLEDRLTPATRTWTGLGATDLWSNAANWDTGLPVGNDIVIIPATLESASVIFDASVPAANASVASLTSDEPFTLSGSTLTVTGNLEMQNGNTFTFSGGTLTSATVLAGTTIRGTNSGGVLSGVTLNGTLELTSFNANVAVTGGLTVGAAGEVRIGDSAGTTMGELRFNGNQTLGGSGSIVFGGSVGNSLAAGPTSGAALTIGENILVHGKSGNVGVSNFLGGSANVSFTNLGTISADVSGGTITLNGVNWSNTAVSPKGVDVVSGAAVTLAGSWTNSGTISAGAGSTLNLGGAFATATMGTITSAGAVVNLIAGTLTATIANPLTLNDATGSWRFRGGTISGGTVTTTGSNVLASTNSGGTLAGGVTLNGTLDLTSFNAHVAVSGGLTLGAGAVVRIGDTAGTTTGELRFDGSQTLGGSGSIVLGGSVGNSLSAGPTAGAALTIGENILVHGKSGSVGVSNFLGGSPNVSFTNLGTISADVAGGTVTLIGTNWTNNGTITAQNGASLILTGISSAANPAWTNVAGRSITVSGSGSLTLTGTRWTNQGIIGAQNGGTLSLSGLLWSNAAGTIALNTSDATVILGGTFATAGVGTITRPGGTGGTVRLTGSLINFGATLHLGAAPTPGSWQFASGRITGGTLSAAAGSALIGGGLLAGNVTLDGTGAGDNLSPLDFPNSGVTVDVAVSSIAADPTGATQSGSTVTITTTTPHGFAAGHNVVIAGVGVSGYNGTVAITSVPTPTTFTYTTTAGLAASGGGSATVHALGGLTLKGAVLGLGNAAGTTSGVLQFGGNIPQTIDGVVGSPGTILFGANTGNAMGGNAVTLGANLTVTGAAGSINSGVVAFNNQGTIAADPAAMGLGLASGTIALNGTNWTNSGTILAQNGGIILAQGTGINTGNLTSGAGSSMSFVALTFNSGTLTGAGPVTISGATIWTGGIMSGSGQTTTNGSLAITANNTTELDGRTLNINGATTVTSGGTPFWRGLNGAIVNNAGVFDVQSDAALFHVGGTAPTFNNTATFRKSAGTEVTTVSFVFNNSGAVEVDTGTLSLTSGGASTGSFTAPTTTTLVFGGGTHDINAGASISGAGTVRFSGGTTNLNGGVYNITGATQSTGGTAVNFNADVTVLAVGPALTVSGGNLNFSSAEAIGVTTLSMSGGRLSGSDNVTISGATTWTGGIISGSGQTTTNGSLAITANNSTELDGRTLNINGGATVTSSGTPFWRGGNGAVVNNAGVFDLQSDADVLSLGGTPTFNNLATGTFRKSAGAGVTNVSFALNNLGTVEASAGTLGMTSVTQVNTGASALTGGTWNVFTNSTLTLNGNVSLTTNNANIVLDGVGSDFTNIAGLANNGATGSFTIQGGRNFTASAALTNAGSVTIGAGSTFTTSAGNYTQTGGTTTVQGTLDPASSADIQGGTLAGTGIVQSNTINAGTVTPGSSPGILTITGDYTQIAAGQLNIEIAGAAPGTQFDRLVVTGQANLDGALSVTRLGGFIPAAPDTFRVVSSGTRAGTFATFNDLTFPGGRFVLLHDATGAVLDANLAPTPASDPETTLEDTAVTTNVVSNDNDPDGDAFMVVAVGTSTQGVTPLNNGNGTISYTPPLNFNGSDVYTYTIRDVAGNETTATVNIGITPVNDAPTVAAPIADLTMNEDAAPVLDHASLDAVFADVDNLDAELTYAVTAATPGGIVTATIDAGATLDLAFLTDAFGEVDITVRASDPGGLFAEDTFHVTVNPINDDPTVASAIADRIVPTSSPPVLNHTDLNAVFADVDDADADLVYSVVANTNGALVTATIEADDTLDLSFAVGQNGVADITIRATDPDGLFVEDTFRVTVNPPVATTTTITQSTPSPSTFGQPVTFTVTVTPGEGTDLPTGTLTFKDGATTLGTSTPLIDEGGVATATFTTTATQLGGGSHTLTAHYAGADAFVAGTSADFTHTVNVAVTTTTIVQATLSPSIVGQTVTFTVTVGSAVVGILPTGTLTVMDGAVTLGVSSALVDVGGVATATFTTAVGQLGVGVHTISAVYAGDANFAVSTSSGSAHTVNPLRAAPDAYNAKMNRKLKVLAVAGLLANDQQAGGQAKLVKKPAKGKLTLKADGSFTYVPARGFLGKVTFKYRVVNTFAVSAPVSVTIKVKK